MNDKYHLSIRSGICEDREIWWSQIGTFHSGKVCFFPGDRVKLCFRSSQEEYQLYALDVPPGVKVNFIKDEEHRSEEYSIEFEFEVIKIVHSLSLDEVFDQDICHVITTVLAEPVSDWAEQVFTGNKLVVQWRENRAFDEEPEAETDEDYDPEDQVPF
jgi:hypothetical protein